MIRTRPLDGWRSELSLHCLRYAFIFIIYISCKQHSRISVSLHSMETAITAYYEVNKRPLLNFNWNPWHFSWEMRRHLHSRLHRERANELQHIEEDLLISFFAAIHGDESAVYLSLTRVSARFALQHNKSSCFPRIHQTFHKRNVKREVCAHHHKNKVKFQSTICQSLCSPNRINNGMT